MHVPHCLRSKVARRVFLIAAIGSVSAVLWIRHETVSARAAEEDALDFVRMHGYTGEGYSASLLTNLVAPLSPSTRIGTTPLRTAGFTANRMTDNMAMQLVSIRHLHSIVLYPQDPNGSGVDFTATTLTQSKSLRELDLPLSERGIALIEDRWPDLVIQVASRPSVNTGP